MATPTTLPASFTSGQVLTAAQMNNLRGAFRILQVNQTVKTDTFTTNSTAFTDLTGLSVSITPSATTNKVLIYYSVQCQGANGINQGALNLVRGSTNILVGDAAGTRLQASNNIAATTNEGTYCLTQMYLDSPSTTSATTYKIQVRTAQAGTIYVNRCISDTDTNTVVRFTSSITAMEISA